MRLSHFGAKSIATCDYLPIIVLHYYIVYIKCICLCQFVKCSYRMLLRGDSELAVVNDV